MALRPGKGRSRVTGRERFQNGITNDDLRDLGFGSRVSQTSQERLLNRDGSFNVHRTGLSFSQSLNLYHSLLTMSWTKFHVMMFVGFFVINGLFAVVYLLCGPAALDGVVRGSFIERFPETFFFSVQTFTTVGYGHITPASFDTNLIATLDAFVGLFSFAFATGLLFARFSRPTAKIIYSKSAIIAPYRNGKGFMFRIANQRKSQLIELHVRLMMTLKRRNGDSVTREYHQLELERDSVVFFPLHWTIVHPITPESRLYGMTKQEMQETEAEFLILLTATDDTFSQTVHSRSSYRYDELIWDVRFADPFVETEEHEIQVDLEKLHAVVPAEEL